MSTTTITAAPPAQRLSVRNGTFDVEYRESGSGTPLLVLHDLFARHAWAPYLDDLAAHYRVIAPTHPGFGSSTGGDRIDDPVDMAIFYTDLLDVLGVDSAHVFGHDLGGMFATEMAAISPGRAQKLVLVAPLGLHADDAEIADLFAIDPAEIPALLWHDPQSEEARAFDALPSEPELAQEATILRQRAHAMATKFTWPFPERGLHKRIHRVSAPALIAWGEQDGFAPPGLARPFLDALPGSTYQSIDAAAHFPMLEQRAAFVGLVREFLG